MQPKPPSQRRPAGPRGQPTEMLKARENVTANQVMAAAEEARTLKAMEDRLAHLSQEHIDAELKQVEEWQAETQKQAVRSMCLRAAGSATARGCSLLCGATRPARA